MKITPRQIVVAGALGAISILLGVTKLGFIPFFLGTSITIMHVPVIVGAVLEGPWVGTAIGLIFGIFSLVWAYIGPNGPGDVYFQNVFISILPRLFIGVMAYLAYQIVKVQKGIRSAWILWFALGISVVAPILAYGTSLLDDNRDMKTLVLITSIVLGLFVLAALYAIWRSFGEIAALSGSAVVGTLTNTVLVLSMMGLMGELGFVPAIPWNVLLVLGITNGIPETIGAVLITVAVVAAWKQLEFGRKGAADFPRQRIMLLCLDISNTIITIGLFSEENLTHHWQIATDVHRTADEYAMMVNSLLKLDGETAQDLQAVCMVSVVPRLTGAFVELCQHYWHLAPLVVDAGVRTGVRIRTENPREVGSDRIVNAVAAFKRYGGPACVVDFSTATSFDAISSEGDYLGGAIAPGMGIALEALTDRAAKLPKIELARPPQAIGRNTVHSMQSGFLYGLVGLVEGITGRFRRELGDEMRVIATGGLADIVARETDAIQILAPWLTLDGLRLIYAMSTG